jgi:signal transduction histidine kinase
MANAGLGAGVQAQTSGRATGVSRRARATAPWGPGASPTEPTAFPERYWDLLVAYLDDGSEASLERGYELANQALANGRSVIELADVHDAALRRLRDEFRASDRALRSASAFLATCLSPFDLSQRQSREGTRALRHLNDVLESELKRIAHTLHDEAGQLLAAVHIAVMDIANDVPPLSRPRFDRVGRLLAQVEAELRSLSHEWRPTLLDDLGLAPALEFLAGNVSRRSGIPVRVSADARTRLPCAVETSLYRIVQEALNNAVKHAAARHIWIELQHLPLQVKCRVRDDGRGLETRREPGAPGLGLAGIRERVHALGGSMHLVTSPSCGMTLEASIPLGGWDADPARR